VPGAVFVAVQGTSQDGHAFIPTAVKQGALVVVGEAAPPAYLAIPYIRVESSRRALSELAAAFHGHPSRGLLMFGVTGTSGKTTTTYLIESILEAAGHRVGVIGTVNFRHGGRVLPSTHTTPGAVELQALLSEMKREGCTAVVMEVSSHSLVQQRVASIAFDGVVFTNLSSEHLDFHRTMEEYYQAKKLLFTEVARAAVKTGKRPKAAVHTDSYGQRLLQELASEPSIQTHGYGEHALSVDVNGIRGRVGGVDVRSPLIGSFNAQNLLAAITVCSAVGVADDAIAAGISALAAVPGRLQAVPNCRRIHVLVDYAHKPDALEKVLKTLSEMRAGHRLITVFGCGGDRDRTKRPVMGRIAVELSDQVYVTSDNPRTENPDRIIEEIVTGIRSAPNACPYEIEPDRRKAIHAAVSSAAPGDLVLIAGKGHEDYQIIASPDAPGGTVKIHLDDREVAMEALGQAKC
jgi:UDP-N-acetylmuramoyl-L-alanyl-D-glutamate--2,6-diaminopimelate ligase